MSSEQELKEAVLQSASKPSKGKSRPPSWKKNSKSRVPDVPVFQENTFPIVYQVSAIEPRVPTEIEGGLDAALVHGANASAEMIHGWARGDRFLQPLTDDYKLGSTMFLTAAMAKLASVAKSAQQTPAGFDPAVATLIDTPMPAFIVQLADSFSEVKHDGSWLIPKQAMSTAFACGLAALAYMHQDENVAAGLLRNTWMFKPTPYARDVMFTIPMIDEHKDPAMETFETKDVEGLKAFNHWAAELVPDVDVQPVWQDDVVGAWVQAGMMQEDSQRAVRLMFPWANFVWVTRGFVQATVKVERDGLRIDSLVRFWDDLKLKLASRVFRIGGVDFTLSSDQIEQLRPRGTVGWYNYYAEFRPMWQALEVDSPRALMEAFGHDIPLQDARGLLPVLQRGRLCFDEVVVALGQVLFEWQAVSSRLKIAMVNLRVFKAEGRRAWLSSVEDGGSDTVVTFAHKPTSEEVALAAFLECSAPIPEGSVLFVANLPAPPDRHRCDVAAEIFRTYGRRN